jgi:hypothetical protein
MAGSYLPALGGPSLWRSHISAELISGGGRSRGERRNLHGLVNRWGPVGARPIARIGINRLQPLMLCFTATVFSNNAVIATPANFPASTWPPAISSRQMQPPCSLLIITMAMVATTTYRRRAAIRMQEPTERILGQTSTQSTLRSQELSRRLFPLCDV